MDGDAVMVRGRRIDGVAVHGWRGATVFLFPRRRMQGLPTVPCEVRISAFTAGVFFFQVPLILRSLLRKQEKTRIIAIDIYRSIYWRDRICIGRSQRDDEKGVRYGAKT